MKASWYWTTIILVCANILSIFTISDTAYPIVYLRYLLGSIYVLFLPGYTLVKVLFPQKELSAIETFALSLGTSLVIVPAISFLLNQTPWGIQTISFTLSMSILIIFFATVGLRRSHKTEP